MSAGREMPRRRAVSLWFLLAASNSTAMMERSNASTRARSGNPGPGSAVDVGGADGATASVSASDRQRESVSLSSAVSASRRATVFSSYRTLPGHVCCLNASMSACSTATEPMP